ncbi:MAG: glycosyltransferase family 2 protein [Mycobacteriales bacterium]
MSTTAVPMRAAPRRLTSGRHQVHVTAVIPAHDEAANIAATLRSLTSQTVRPVRVVVVADNCTDATAAIARAHGAEVIETVDNTAKKAGALNQALRELMAGTPDGETILVLDADSTLSFDFIRIAARQIAADPSLGAVGGIFLGDRPSSVLERMQANEYARYSRDIARHRGRVFVLSGTGSLIRASALRSVQAARGNHLPGNRGDAYDPSAITEDNELTLALKTMGWDLVSPAECQVFTELMPSWRDLWKQRLRWQRGAIDNVRAYGLNRITARYWGQQIGLGVGIMAMAAYLLLMTVTTITDGVRLQPLWLGIGAIFVLERVVTVWTHGWRARLLAVLMLPELLFDLFLMAVFVRSLIDLSRNSAPTWHHVGAPATG